MEQTEKIELKSRNEDGAVKLMCDERLFDLVRFMRAELYDAELITNDEYVELCTEGATGLMRGSVRRLETYDELINRVKKLETELDEFRR